MHIKSERQVELEARLEEISQKKLKLQQEAQATMAELRDLLEEEQADIWGLTIEEYQEAKVTAYPDREAQRDLDALRAQIGKLTARASDPRKSDEVRKQAAAEAHTLSFREPEQAAAVNALSQQRIPLTAALNRKRRAKRLAERNAQQATAQVAEASARVKRAR